MDPERKEVAGSRQRAFVPRRASPAGTGWSSFPSTLFLPLGHSRWVLLSLTLRRVNLPPARPPQKQAGSVRDMQNGSPESGGDPQRQLDGQQGLASCGQLAEEGGIKGLLGWLGRKSTFSLRAWRPSQTNDVQEAPVHLPWLGQPQRRGQPPGMKEWGGREDNFYPRGGQMKPPWGSWRGACPRESLPHPLPLTKKPH